MTAMPKPAVGQTRVFCRTVEWYPNYDFAAYWRCQGEATGCVFGKHVETVKYSKSGPYVVSVATVTEVRA